MTVFHLVRHGQPAWELVEQRGWTGAARDWVPLRPAGIAQIERAAEGLRRHDAQLILSSPMTRALQSAAILGRLLDLPLQVEFDLHEWLPDLDRQYDRTVIRAAEEELIRLGGEWPAGETRTWEPMSSVRKRVTGVLERYNHFDHVLVVCHGMVIRSLVGMKEVEMAEHVEYIL